MTKLVLFFCFLTAIYAQEITVQDNDSDNDMIIDKYDKCPNTPDGVCVDKDGCTQEITRVIHFNPSSFKIDQNATMEVQSIIEIAQECFGYDIVIQGHTDSTYEAEFNFQLSEKRTKSIKELFLLHNIDSKRIQISWHGETNPISTNITNQGRYKNRRVEVIFK